MALRKTLRSPGAVLARASLGACLLAMVGCNVYEDELLSRPDDGGRPPSDAGGWGEPATKDGPGSIDASGQETADVKLFDSSAPDAMIDTNAGIPDASVPDGTPSDAGQRADIGTVDQGGASDDAADVRSDATLDSRLDTAFDDARDADGGSPTLDAADAAAGDAARDARDGAGSLPDVGTDADGSVPPPTFRVVRVGDGATELSAASAAAFIEERGWDGKVVGQPLALPTTASGGQHPLTLSGNATSEGALSLSLDGRYLTLAGYATSAGRGNIASSTDVERVVARVDAASSVDTTTLLGDVFSGSNARSAASVDGASFWVGGSSGGVWYVGLGGSGRAQIVSTPNNVRLVALFADQLYGSSGATPMTGVFTVGIGRPTSGAQNVAALAGMPQSGSSPYAFAMFDCQPAVIGLDTLYLADDRSPENDGNGGGIQKWTFDGNAWSRVATWTSVGGGTVSFRGLAGIETTAGIMLVATTSETSTNRLVVFVDDGSRNPTGTVIATAPSRTIFRGVALSPHP